MTPEEMALAREAILHTVGQAVVALCLVATGLTIAVGFWRGRGMESVWPDEEEGHPEPLAADVPRSTD